MFTYWVEYASQDHLYLKLFVAGLWCVCGPFAFTPAYH
jgi:hypothetical protein